MILKTKTTLIVFNKKKKTAPLMLSENLASVSDISSLVFEITKPYTWFCIKQQNGLHH